MKIDSLDDLEKLIALCRRKGLSKIEVDGLKVELGEAPKSFYKRKQFDEKAVTKPLTEEQVLYWSTGGVSE